jgi:hypothetical protein
MSAQCVCIPNKDRPTRTVCNSHTNTDNSLVLAHYAGISSVDTLFDTLNARLPTQAELREASRGNDCASARLFMRQVDAFIRYALDIDPISRKRLSFRGLFGDVKAYFGMVETKGRGTLHIHFLLWLNNCPANSTAVENILKSSKGDLFREKVASYAQSIVTNDLPITLDACGCPNCGACFAELVGLPIPDQSRQDPRRGSWKRGNRCEVVGSVLIECSQCSTRFSSQHLLRSALLKLRPRCWPVWEGSLSVGEIDEQASVEASCRDTAQHAVNAVFDRESVHASFCSDMATQESGFIAAELLQQMNYTQMPLCKMDDDLFRNEELTRLLEISHPSPSDARMSRRSLDYMVSALAVLFNQHLWCHTTSSFKQSRTISNDTYCRYRFPRLRVANSSFGSSGVELRRTLGHEFMNGFNYEIMATFKCNHDVHVLLGGSGVTDRIHYCCKYVTKQQKQVDSQVAVAVAALKRREMRENVESAGALGAAAKYRFDRSRKRVAGMIYNMTNRQETAGPLAALYLYRGSCCYSSAKCAILPLGDVIRQLTKSDDYSCQLVSNTGNSETSTFHAVSSLDDYVFRPETLLNVNLYEFTMRYFRRKSEGITTSRLTFIDGHPLHSTHCLGMRHEGSVPVIRGFRMPNSDDGDASLERRCKYAVISLVLFKPFHLLDDLIGPSEGSDEQAWLGSFEQWKPQRSIFVEDLMNNMDDYYSGLQKVNAKREKEREAEGKRNPDGSYGASSDQSDDELYHANDIDDFDCSGGVMEEEEGDKALIRMWDLEGDSNFVLDSSSLDPAACPTSVVPDSKVAHIVHIFRNRGILANVAEKTARDAVMEWPTAGLPSINAMKKWFKDADTDNALLTSVPAAVVSRDVKVVEILDQSLLKVNMEWHPPSSYVAVSAKLCKSFASISDTSRAYTLNERQHYAFTVIGKALLSR